MHSVLMRLILFNLHNLIKWCYRYQVTSLRPHTCPVVELILNPDLVDFKAQIILTLLCQCPLTRETYKQKHLSIGKFHINHFFAGLSFFALNRLGKLWWMRKKRNLIFDSRFCNLLAVWSQASILGAQILYFPLCEVGVIITALQSCWEFINNI